MILVVSKCAHHHCANEAFTFRFSEKLLIKFIKTSYSITNFPKNTRYNNDVKIK